MLSAIRIFTRPLIQFSPPSVLWDTTAAGMSPLEGQFRKLRRILGVFRSRIPKAPGGFTAGGLCSQGTFGMDTPLLYAISVNMQAEIREANAGEGQKRERPAGVPCDFRRWR